MSPKVSILALPLVLVVGAAAHALEVPNRRVTQAETHAFETDRVTSSHSGITEARNYTRATNVRAAFWSGTPKTKGRPAIVVH